MSSHQQVGRGDLCHFHTKAVKRRLPSLLMLMQRFPECDRRAATAAAGNLEVCILRHRPRPAGLKTLGVEPVISVLTSLQGTWMQVKHELQGWGKP